MLRTKLGLFKDDEAHRQIKSMRTTARDLIDKQSVLVKQLWSIERELVLPSDETVKVTLREQKEKLLQEITDKDYASIIDKLLVDIKTREIELDGHSDIGGKDPYIL